MSKKNRRTERRPLPSTVDIKRVEPGSPLTEEEAARWVGELGRERDALDQHRSRLDVERVGLSAEIKALDERESALDTRDEEAGRSRSVADAARRDLEQRSARLDERTRVVVEREALAEAGFAERSDKALATLEARLASVSEAVRRADVSLAEKRIQAQASLDDEVGRERSARLTALGIEIDGRRRDLEREFAGQRKEVVAAIEAERAAWDQLRFDAHEVLAGETKAAATARAALDGREADLAAREATLKYERLLLTSHQKALVDTVAQEKREAAAGEIGRITALEAALARSGEANVTLERRLTAMAKEQAMLGDQPAAEVLAERATLRGKVRDLEDQLLVRPGPEVKATLDELLAEKRGWDRKVTDLAREVGRLKEERQLWLTGQRELEHVRDLADQAERRREAVLAESEKLAEDVKRLRKLYETPKEKEARIGVMQDPWFGSLRRAHKAPDSELAWLASIQSGCATVGMHFPDRLLHAFHTSLKCAEWSSLAVLAGVSGTGKSEMPRLYAHFGGLAYLPLSVEPNWDSPQSLMGFFNAIDNRFNAKPLLRSLVQSQSADPVHGLEDRLLLVLLDEMNLAHVELYFSDLLSKLEDRRGKQEGQTTLEIDLGAGLDPYKLPLGRNVLWTGTMNEDATTRSLSDKVVDRANVLVFPRPATFRRRGRITLPPAAPLLHRGVWDNWLTEAPLEEADIAPYKAWLEQVNGHLERAGRALGHRVWQSVEAYLGAHPQVVHACASEDMDARRKALRLAFEDAVVLKVMPKLRGIETAGTALRECLQPIQTLLDDPSIGLRLGDDFRHGLRVGHGAFVWSSARYLESQA